MLRNWRKSSCFSFSQNINKMHFKIYLQLSSKTSETVVSSILGEMPFIYEISENQGLKDKRNSELRNCMELEISEWYCSPYSPLKKYLKYYSRVQPKLYYFLSLWSGLFHSNSYLSKYNHGHNILRIFYVLPNFPFTRSKTKPMIISNKESQVSATKMIGYLFLR